MATPTDPTPDPAPPHTRPAPTAGSRQSLEAPEPATAPRVPGDRFFARIISAELECPACGVLITIEGRKQRTLRKRAIKTLSAIWTPEKQELRCRRCRKVFVLGMLAWQREVAGNATAVRPHDTIPTLRQALRLRQLHGGRWTAARLRRTGGQVRVNRILDPLATCICRPAEQDAVMMLADPRCPVHGLYTLTPRDRDDRNPRGAHQKFAVWLRDERARVIRERLKAEHEEREEFWSQFGGFESPAARKLRGLPPLQPSDPCTDLPPIDSED